MDRPIDRFAYSIFCDDIRQEVGNKVSFMGVYGPDMLVPSFPFVIHKLCCAVSVVTPVDRPFKQATIRLLKDDELVSETIIPDEQFARIDPQPIPEQLLGPDDDLVRRLHLHATFIIAGMPIETPCRLRVKVQTEHEELRSNGLFIHSREKLATTLVEAPRMPVSAKKIERRTQVARSGLRARGTSSPLRPLSNKKK